MLIAAACVLGAYLLGSVPFAVLVSRVFGLADPRSYGSRNPGATNVLRSGNTAAAVLTLIGDAFKGWLAVWLAQRYAAPLGLEETSIALIAVAVVVGHLWPVFLRFAGGKGVATAFGVLLAVQPWLGLGSALTWVIVAFFFRYSSMASLATCAFAPFFYALGWGLDPLFAAIVVIAALVAVRHQRNIANLMAGRESRLGQKAPPATSAAARGQRGRTPKP